MSRRQARTTGLDRERARRQKIDRNKRQDATGRVEVRAEPAPGSSPGSSAGRGRISPADETIPMRDVTGVRLPGQRVSCGWCGAPVTVKSRGPVPKWCSPTCRHRAWEQARASASGRVALTVVDRYITAVPRDTEAWLGQLDALAIQVRGRGLDLPMLRTAIEVVLAAIEAQERRHPADVCW
jgi:hypothetical protein